MLKSWTDVTSQVVLNGLLHGGGGLISGGGHISRIPKMFRNDEIKRARETNES